MPEAQAEIVRVAQAVAWELDNRTFTLKPAINRTYVPDLRLDEIGELRVDVQGVEGELRKAARSGPTTTHTCPVDVIVRKRFKAVESNAATGEVETNEIDRLIKLLQEFHVFLEGRPLTMYPEAKWTGTMYRPLMSQVHLHKFRQFTGIVVVTYEVTV
jgi:hypothetical protein